jgi:hypothetical protein
MKIGVDVVNIVRPTTGSIDDFINSFEPQANIYIYIYIKAKKQRYFS